MEFRKRLTDEIIGEINEIIIDYNTPDDPEDDGTSGGGTADSRDGNQNAENKGILILDTTCAPQNIRFPQDINLLNEARENLERMIDSLCDRYGYYKPRLYRENARKDYLSLAKCRKRNVKKIRNALEMQLQYAKRNRRYIDEFLGAGCELTEKLKDRLSVIDKVLEQQEYMYKNKVHSVPEGIVSIDQPHIRPKVRGKAPTPTEFGAKMDLSLDENGMARLEKLSYEAYNESDVLIGAIERYAEREGHYPERVLMDQIYRTRKSLSFCKERGIRMSVPLLGRPRKDVSVRKEERKIAYKDNTDRITVERAFALAKHSYGLVLIIAKLDETTRNAIAISVLTMNIDRILAKRMFIFFAKKYGLIRRAILETIQGSNDGLCVAAAY